MTEAADDGFGLSARHAIVAATLAAAALAGAAVGALDYPWLAGGAKPERQAAQRRAVVAVAPSRASVAAPRAVVATPATIAPVAPVAKAARPAPVRTARSERRRRPADPPKAASRPASAAPSIDARYARDAARRCARGMVGLLCRESLKWRLCDGRWGPQREPGRTLCHVDAG